MTTFTNARPAAAPGATHAGGPDPLLLTAALQALAGAPGGQSGGDDCRKQLVGDSELANTTELSTDMTGGAVHLALHGGSWQHSGASRSAGASGGHEAHLLSSSWDAADGAGAVGVRLAALEVHAQLVGSAPTRGAASSPPPSAHGSAGGLRHRTLSQVRPCCAASLPCGCRCCDALLSLSPHAPSLHLRPPASPTPPCSRCRRCQASPRATPSGTVRS